MKRSMRMLLVAGTVAMLAGCSGDMTQALVKSPEMQAKVMDLITQNAPMAGQMVDKLLGSDATRAMVMEKIMGSGDAMQGMMANMAKNETMVDGILNVAVQDSVMRSHVMGVLEGMKMAAKK